MFIKRFGWLILLIVAFVSGMIVTVQWIGTEHGMQVYDFFKRPDVVEKIVQVEVVKVIVVSDNMKIQMINQEYRDALMKISAIKYDRHDNENKLDSINNYAVKALSVPGMVSNMDDK